MDRLEYIKCIIFDTNLPTVYNNWKFNFDTNSLDILPNTETFNYHLDFLLLLSSIIFSRYEHLSMKFNNLLVYCIEISLICEFVSDKFCETHKMRVETSDRIINTKIFYTQLPDIGSYWV